MNTSQKYSKNPITEALIDIQVEPSIPMSALENLPPSISEEYPEKKTLHIFETTLKANADATPAQAVVANIQGTREGFQFWSKDKTEVMQYRSRGFSYSRLRPYDDWEVHFPKMFERWNLFYNSYHPVNIKRIAVRFINLFEIPFGEFNLIDFFNSPPEIPKGVTDKLENFLLRLAVSGDKEMKAFVTFTPRRPTAPNISQILLDVDVYKKVSWAATYSGLKDEFQILHKFANNIFESYITDRIRELIK